MSVSVLPQNGVMDVFNLERFLDGQRFGYEYALNEMKSGRKEGHWIWYVFPQMKGLGYSPNFQFYGISGKEEAKAYLEHPVLGARLREITGTLLAIEGKTAEEILSSIDAMKVRSSMTLFDAVCPDEIFADVLAKYYDSKKDPATLKLL